jgi:hypothetical protein
MLKEIENLVNFDKKALQDLKMFATKHQLFETACYLREKQQELFPEKPEIKAIKSEVNEFSSALRLVGINATDEKTNFVLLETFRKFSKLKGKFSLKDGAVIQAKADEIYGK